MVALRTLAAGDFLGTTLSTRRFEGFALFSARYEPAARFARHDHEQASICLVRKGAYEEDYGRHACTYARGAVVLHPAGDHHANSHAPEEVQLLVIEFAPSWLEALQARTNFLSQRGWSQSSELARLGARLESEANRSDAASSLACEGIVLELVSAMARACQPKGGAPAWLKRVEAALRAGSAEAASLATLSQLAGVHATQVARVFRREHGCSVGAFKRRLMLEEAQQRLETTSAPLAQIALDCGFADQSHFSRCFQGAYGATPGRYRRERSRFSGVGASGANLRH